MYVYVQFSPPLELAFEPRCTASQTAEKLGAEGIVLTPNTQFTFYKGARSIETGEGWGSRDRIKSPLCSDVAERGFPFTRSQEARVLG